MTDSKIDAAKKRIREYVFSDNFSPERFVEVTANLLSAIEQTRDNVEYNILGCKLRDLISFQMINPNADIYVSGQWGTSSRRATQEPDSVNGLAEFLEAYHRTMRNAAAKLNSIIQNSDVERNIPFYKLLSDMFDIIETAGQYYWSDIDTAKEFLEALEKIDVEQIDRRARNFFVNLKSYFAKFVNSGGGYLNIDYDSKGFDILDQLNVLLTLYSTPRSPFFKSGEIKFSLADGKYQLSMPANDIIGTDPNNHPISLIEFLTASIIAANRVKPRLFKWLEDKAGAAEILTARLMGLYENITVKLREKYPQEVEVNFHKFNQLRVAADYAFQDKIGELCIVASELIGSIKKREVNLYSQYQTQYDNVANALKEFLGFYGIDTKEMKAIAEEAKKSPHRGR